MNKVCLQRRGIIINVKGNIVSLLMNRDTFQENVTFQCSYTKYNILI